MSKEPRLEFLKSDLRQEIERFFWIFLPVAGWIIMIVIAIQKANRTVSLENNCNDLRDQIRELENELMKERIEKFK